MRRNITKRKWMCGEGIKWAATWGHQWRWRLCLLVLWSSDCPSSEWSTARYEFRYESLSFSELSCNEENSFLKTELSICILSDVGKSSTINCQRTEFLAPWTDLMILEMFYGLIAANQYCIACASTSAVMCSLMLCAHHLLTHNSGSWREVNYYF